MYLPKLITGATLAAASIMPASAQVPPAAPATVPATVPATTAPTAAPVQLQAPLQPRAAAPAGPTHGPAVNAAPPAAPPSFDRARAEVHALAIVRAQAELAAAQLPDNRADDDTFIALREAARAGDAAKADSLAVRLPQYMIPSYVEYYRLKPRLATASPDELRAFLARYQGTAVADRLRNDWLLELGRARDWANFSQQYPLFVLNDDVQVKCYWLMARVARGEKVADEARAALASPPAYGEACNALMVSLAQAGQFDANDLLVQLRLAGETGSTGPAKRAAELLGASDTRAAQAVDFPALAMARGIGSTRAEHEIYLVAISRMARSSLKLALIAFEKNLPSFTPQEQGIGWAVIAHAASLKHDPDAHTYWSKSAAAPLTLEQMQWKTRIALRRLDWKAVKASIEAMPGFLSAQPAWTYWLARALQAEGGAARNESATANATAMYRGIADQHNFYGQLALEELGQLITIPPPGAPLTADEIAPMAANPALKRALKFFSLRMRAEGMREWNWEARKFTERELLAAAEFARRNDVLDRMVYTSERTRTQFDYTQRFPAPHSDILSPTTRQLGLDKAWVYGLIRQESRFVMDARSSVGASGLMQVMPATAQFVARKIGLDFAKDKLTDLRTNLVLGSNYLNMVLENAGGSQPLATAAYNAGPGRMRTWRASLEAPMEGAIWAESIPFLETRVYVKNVMANATNYAALFDNKPQSLKARLGTIAPRGAQGADLP
ncbi:transglycosylase SLT domain-containing protein [Massilia sp. TWP1-3-3]|uniref:lytic transglycosylase domain-containing protein n=1 Tax=Massilia sp. TWP1-3-3 TaxID=2804573 RepID=UPI003CF84248